MAEDGEEENVDMGDAGDAPAARGAGGRGAWCEARAKPVTQMNRGEQKRCQHAHDDGGEGRRW